MANIEEINGKRYLKLECKLSPYSKPDLDATLWLPIDDLQEALFGADCGQLVATVNGKDLQFVLDRNKRGGDIDGTPV